MFVDVPVVSMILPRVPMATAMARDIGGIRGVRLADVQMVDEHIDLTASLGEYADRKTASLEMAAPVGVTVSPGTRRAPNRTWLS